MSVGALTSVAFSHLIHRLSLPISSLQSQLTSSVAQALVPSAQPGRKSFIKLQHTCVLCIIYF